MNVVELFLAAAEKYPKQTAIADARRSISYSGLKDEVLSTAAYFRKKGIAPGDRVMVFVPMSIDLYRVVLGLFQVGATAVFLDEWVSKERLELCCRIAECKGFIGIPKARFFALFSKELRGIPVKLSLRKRAEAKESPYPVREDDSALITFTTGSTGTPKAADRSHAFLRAQFDALLDEIQPKVGDVDMPALPIVLFMNLGVGCTSVIPNFRMKKLATMSMDKIVQQVQEHKVNRITSSPFFIERLSEYPSETFTSVEKIFTGGAPVFPTQAARFKKAFPDTIISVVYGSTEAEPMSSITANELMVRHNDLSKGLPVGVPYHKAEIQILDLQVKDHEMTSEEFRRSQVADSEIGEIVVSGPHVLKRYFRNDDAFRENKIVVEDTVWHRTGDSGFLKNGELFLTGRCAQLIPRDGKFLSPFIIENSLLQLPGVKMGTLLEHENKLICVVETQRTKEEIAAEIVHITYDELLIRNIPRDPRHHSKIDYAALKQSI